MPAGCTVVIRELLADLAGGDHREREDDWRAKNVEVSEMF